MSQNIPGDGTSNLEGIQDKSKSHDGKLDQAPDSTVVRNASGETISQARDANPDKHSGSAGGNPDDGSFTLVALTGDKITVVAERSTASNQSIRQKEQLLVSEQDLLARSKNGDVTAGLLLKELAELRLQKLPNQAEEQAINKILSKASKIYPANREQSLSLSQPGNAASINEELNAEPPGVKDYRRDSSVLSDRAPHLTPQQSAIEKKFGVKIVMNGEKAEYHLHANGRDTLLFESSKDDIAGSQKQLQAMVKEHEDRLTSTFGVTFSKDKETAGYVLDADLQPTKEIAHCRAPRLDELIGIEAGLSHSAPSQYSNSGKPLEFVFIAAGQHHISGRPIGANYEYGEPPKVFMDPSTDSNVPTERDKTGNWGRSTEYQVIHELSHGAQERIHFREKIDDKHMTIEEQFANEAGWAKNPTDNQFYLRGKHDGEFYKCDKLDSTKWEKYALGKDEKPYPVGAVTSAQVRADALITPPTDYMQNPKEEMSECLTAYRLGGHYRDSIKFFPQLYDMIRRIDQADINKGYPPDSSGNYQYLRAENGGLEKNPSFGTKSTGQKDAKKH